MEAVASRREAIGRAPELQEALVADLVEVMQAPFQEEDGYRLGVTDSAKEVFFGKSEGRLIAVKPFCELTVRDRAEHEASMMNTAQKKGFHVLSNPRVYDGGMATYLVTDYVANLSPMNNTGWDQSEKPDLYEHEISPLLRKMGSFIGDVHGNGISHGDLGLKNLPRRKDGVFYLVDLEKAQDCSDMTEDEQISMFSGDVTVLLCDLVRRNFLYASGWERTERELLSTLGEPYIEGMTQAGKRDIALSVVESAMRVAQTTYTFKHGA
jgi:RIO-like serine/threonine protein kinase